MPNFIRWNHGKFVQGHKRSAKLNPEQVLEIRRLYAEENWTQGRLAREFKMSVGQIGRIVRGEQWGEYTQIPTEQEIYHSMVTSPPPADEVSASLERLKALMKTEETRNDDEQSDDSSFSKLPSGGGQEQG